MLQLQFVIIPIIAVAFAVAGVLFGVRFRSTWNRLKGTPQRRYRSLSYDDKSDFPSYWLRGVAYVLAGLLVLVTVLWAIPFAPKYWVITHPSGTIAASSYRNGQTIFRTDDGGTVYVVELKGDSNQYLVNDDRISKFKAGDHVNLACTLGWVYGGRDQINCSLGN